MTLFITSIAAGKNKELLRVNGSKLMIEAFIAEIKSDKAVSVRFVEPISKVHKAWTCLISVALVPVKANR